MVKLYNRSNVIGAFSALNSISIGYENNNARTIQFTDNGNTISFQLFNLQQIIGSTTTVTYDPIDVTSTGPEYNNRVFEVFDFLSSEVFQGFSPGPTYVGGVVAAYPNFASFPVTGTQSVIYIDEADNSAYYWDGTSYQLLVSTGVEQYASFALFPVTGSANVIYIDMSVPEPYVWNGTAYESLGGGAVTSVDTAGLISGGPITGSGTITTSMATNKLVGRYSAGTGIMEEITIGSGLTLTGAGILNNTATPTPIGYYGAFQDNTRQIAAAINTPYAVRLNTTDLSDSVTIVNNGSGDPTRITIANTGVYNIQFSLQLEKSGGSGNMTANIWLRKNGVDVPSTTGKVVLTGSASASPVIAAWNYVLDVVGGDYYELMWAVSNIHVEIFAEAATPPHPATPSAILTVTQQSGIMAGTGITAINSLTGSVQTLATGTTGTDFAISSTGTTHTFNLPTASATNRGALSSTDWTTFNSKLSGLTVGTTPITSGTVGRVLFEGTGNVLQESANFFWDNTNSRLGVGTATPLVSTDIRTSSNSPITPLVNVPDSATTLLIGNTGTNGVLAFGQNNTSQAWIQARSRLAGASANVLLLNPLGGNVLIGTTTDAGFKLDVNGTARVQGNAQFGTGFYWDNTNSRLGIGTATPAYQLSLAGSANIQGVTGLNLLVGTRGIFFGLTGSTEVSTYLATSPLIFSLNQGSTPVARFSATNGNFLINTTTDAGFRLDVNGTARFKGASNVGTTTALTVINSDSTTLLQVQDNGYIRIGSQTTSAFRIYSTDASGDAEPAGLHLVLNSRVVAQSQAFNVGMVMLNGINGTATTGTQNVFLISKGFAPTSGTATYAAFSLIPTINQTGGANGITRGLYINPTLTAATDFRAIETTAGNILFNGGNVGIGVTSAANRLQVKSSAINTDVISILNTSNTSLFRVFNGGGGQAIVDIGGSVFLRSDAALSYINSGGNFAIGTSTDAGFKLDVNGTTRLNGLSSINGVGVANTALAVYGNGNGGGNYLFRMYDASAVERFYLTASGNFRLNGATDTSTTGTDEKWRMVLNFAPTSGTREHNGIYLTQTINQTGGANGITRGLVIQPTLTAAADYRAIETTAGKVIFNGGNVGIGTASPTQALTIASGSIAMTESFPIRWGTSNLLYGSATGLDIASSAFAVRFRFTVGGNFLIGTTTDAGFKLDVNGTTRTSGTALFQNSSFGSAIQINNQTGSAFSLAIYSNAAADTNFQTQGNFNGNNFRITAAGFAMGRGGLPTLDASALLNVNSTTQGFLPPRMTNAQRLAIASPAVGLIVYCTDLVEGLYVNKSTGWTFVI
jgi:hypothetical protein